MQSDPSLRLFQQLMCRWQRFIDALRLKKWIRAARSELAHILSQQEQNSSYGFLFDCMAHLDRVLFIHIPKCGGTSLEKSLVTDVNCVPVAQDSVPYYRLANFFMASAVLPESFEQQFLQKFVGSADPNDVRDRYFRMQAAYKVACQPSRIFAIGHKSLRDLAPLSRGERDIFMTTVRAPADILKSLVGYRVFRIFEGGEIASRLLQKLQLDTARFETLVESDPEYLTNLILGAEATSLCQMLQFDVPGDGESVWCGSKRNKVFIAHMSEQQQMLQQIFGTPIQNRVENTSSKWTGIGSDFKAVVEDAWLRPFINPEDAYLYDCMTNAGIFGFWRDGRTPQEWSTLLESS